MNYENIILLNDFNVKVKEKNMSEFMIAYNLRNLVKQKTFKNPENLSFINVTLTNSTRIFQNSSVFETGPLHFHKLTFTVLKECFPKLKPNVVKYRDYRKFRNDKLTSIPCETKIF